MHIAQNCNHHVLVIEQKGMTFETTLIIVFPLFLKKKEKEKENK
jgi:hypothetical protein